MDSKAIRTAAMMVGALAAAGATMAGAQDDRVLLDGQPVRSVLGTGGADVWTFAGTPGDAVHITLSSGVVDTVLKLWSPAGELVAESDDVDLSTDSEVKEILPSDGIYEVHVTAYDRRAGPYELALNALPVRRLEPEVAVSGTLRPGSHGAWVFDGVADESIRIEAASGAFDVYTELRAPDGEVIASDDDGGDGTNSSLAVPLTVAGPHQLWVSAVFDRPGRYDLVLHTDRPRASRTDGETPFAVGALDPDDPVYVTGEHRDRFHVEVEVGAKLIAELQSDQFSPYIAVRSPSGTLISSGGSHEGSPARVEVDVTESGTWRIDVTSAAAGETGTYELWVDHGAGPIQLDGVLEPADGESRDGGYGDIHFIEGRADHCLAVTLGGTPGLEARVLGPAGRLLGASAPVASSAGTAVLEDVPAVDGMYRVLVTAPPGVTGPYNAAVAFTRCTDSTSSGPAEGPELFGLFLGISDYAGRAPDLPRTADDASRLAEALVTAGAMSADNATVLVDRQATTANLRAAIEEMRPRIGSADTFVLMFSGHGDRLRRVGPQPADPDGYDETIELFDGPLRDDALNELLNDIEAGLTVVVLDSCFSGGFAKDLISVPGRIGLFSSEEDTTSEVSPTAGGYLSQFVHDALGADGADDDGDGLLRAIELRQYLHERYRAEVVSDASEDDVFTSFGYLVDRLSRLLDGSEDDVVNTYDRAYQHLQVDPGSVRPHDVLFRLQPR